MVGGTAAIRVAVWLIRAQRWARAALPIAIVLLVLSPALLPLLGLETFLIFVQLPLYMLHQYEEHGHGAFKAFMNRLLVPRGGRLTDGTIALINIPCVWGVDLVALYLARRRGPASGLVAPYLALVNGLIHVGGALGQRRYNPGLWTSLLLFLPVGGVSVGRIGRASRQDHVRGLGAAVLLHVVAILIIIWGFRARPGGVRDTSRPSRGTRLR